MHINSFPPPWITPTTRLRTNSLTSSSVSHRRHHILTQVSVGTSSVTDRRQLVFLDGSLNDQIRLTVIQEGLGQFQNFDTYNNFDIKGIPQALTPQSQHQPHAHTSTGGLDRNSETLNSEQRQGSNSDDEDMTPAQSRRKAQNRAA